LNTKLIRNIGIATAVVIGVIFGIGFLDEMSDDHSEQYFDETAVEFCTEKMQEINQLRAQINDPANAENYEELKTKLDVQRQLFGISGC
jgi:hypothetical protein